MQESTNSAGESQASDDNVNAGESAHASADNLQKIAELLQPSEPEGKPDGDDKSEKPGESQAKGKPETINDVAERLGVDVKDLFDVKFPLGNQAGGDGESRTLSELKDIATEHNQLEVDRLTFDETKAKREAELVRAQSELQEIVAMLPKKAVTQELLQVIANKRAAVIEREEKLTLRAIPEWIDEDVQTTDRKQMSEHLQQYGFAPNYLESVTDSKTLAYIRQNMQRQQRIERVLSQIKEVKKPGHKPSGKPSAKPPSQGKTGKARTVDTQTQQVADILREAASG